MGFVNPILLVLRKYVILNIPIVFHAEAPTEIRQIDRSIPIGISDKDGKPVLCGQRASEYRKK